MSLQDVVSSAGLATFPEVALVIFLAAFAAVAARVYLGRGSEGWDERAARLPLEEGCRE